MIPPLPLYLWSLPILCHCQHFAIATISATATTTSVTATAISATDITTSATATTSRYIPAITATTIANDGNTTCTATTSTSTTPTITLNGIVCLIHNPFYYHRNWTVLERSIDYRSSYYSDHFSSMAPVFITDSQLGQSPRLIYKHWPHRIGWSMSRDQIKLSRMRSEIGRLRYEQKWLKLG